jgi:hypothetical protein
MRPARPTAAELANTERFELLEVWPDSTFPPWLVLYMSKTTWITVVYRVWVVSALIAAPALRAASGCSFLLGFACFSAGLLVGGTVLPFVHEHIHALAYRLMGARDVRISYGAGLRTAVCSAPGEVLSGGQYLVVALAPLLGLNSVLVASTVFARHGAVAVGLASALFVHLRGCRGDIGVLNYMWAHRGDRLFVFDQPVTAFGAFYRAKPLAPDNPH